MSAHLMIDVEAALDCELDGQRLSVNARQGVIVVNVEKSALNMATVRHFRRFGKLRLTVRRVNDALLATSHRLELHANDVMILRMGHGTKSGLLQLAGFHQIRVWPLRLLRWPRAN